MRLTVADLRIRSLALRRKLHAVKADTRVASRAGWTVERSLRHGAPRGSDPSTRDERAYLLLRRT